MSESSTLSVLFVLPVLVSRPVRYHVDVANKQSPFVSISATFYIHTLCSRAHQYTPLSVRLADKIADDGLRPDISNVPRNIRRMYIIYYYYYYYYNNYNFITIIMSISLLLSSTTIV